METRWDPYFLRRGEEFSGFWGKSLRAKELNVLYILGKGFDPRMITGLESLLNVGGRGLRDCFILDYNEGDASPSLQYQELVTENMERLSNLLSGRGNIAEKQIQMWSNHGRGRRRIGARSATNVVASLADLTPYTDVIIDISALPRGIYFPLIGKALHILDVAQRTQVTPYPNLHIVVCENPSVDEKIKEVGLDDSAQYLHGFGIDLALEATADVPKVWVPVLGEGQRGQLERIYNLVEPDEICPVLPFPSLNPRRADNLLYEYNDVLFDQWRVEPSNISYASEQNPIDVYRQIHTIARQYNQVLQPLGGCKLATSALSSKLLSVGVLLATYELKTQGLKVALAHIDTQGYTLDPSMLDPTANENAELFTLWVAGEDYD